MPLNSAYPTTPEMSEEMEWLQGRESNKERSAFAQVKQGMVSLYRRVVRNKPHSIEEREFSNTEALDFTPERYSR